MTDLSIFDGFIDQWIQMLLLTILFQLFGVPDEVAVQAVGRIRIHSDAPADNPPNFNYTERSIPGIPIGSNHERLRRAVDAAVSEEELFPSTLASSIRWFGKSDNPE